jgi:hypothetical protein
MKALNMENTAMIKIVLLVFCLGFLDGCQFFAMTLTDNIPVKNHSEYKLDILTNESYPDTSFSNARLNSYINPHEDGGIVLVNRSWKEYLEEKEKITLFFVEWKPNEYYNRDGTPKGDHKIYGKMILTKAKLDSLGGIITFPLEKE